MGKHKSHRGVLGKRKSHRKFLKKFRQFQRERFNRSTPERIDVWNENWKKNFFPKYENPILKELGVNITEEHGETIFNNLKNIKQKMEEQLKRTEDLLPDFLSDFNEENGCKLTFKMLKDAVSNKSEYYDIAEKFWEYMSDRAKIKDLLLNSLNSFNEEKSYKLTFKMLKDSVSDESKYRDIAEEFWDYVAERHNSDYLLSTYLDNFNFENECNLGFNVLNYNEKNVEAFWNYVKADKYSENLDIDKIKKLCFFNFGKLRTGDLAKLGIIGELKKLYVINKLKELDDMDTYLLYNLLPIFIEIVEKLINEFDSMESEDLFDFVDNYFDKLNLSYTLANSQVEIIYRILDFVYAIVSEEHRNEIFDYINSLEFDTISMPFNKYYSEASDDISKAIKNVEEKAENSNDFWEEINSLQDSYVFLFTITSATSALFDKLFEKHSEELEKLVPDKNEPDSDEPDSYENYKDKLDKLEDKLINKFISEFNNTPDIDINPEQDQQEIPPMEIDLNEIGAK